MLRFNCFLFTRSFASMATTNTTTTTTTTMMKPLPTSMIHSSSSSTQSLSLSPSLIPIYQPPTVQALIHDFVSHHPIAIAQLPHYLYASPIRRDILHRCVIWQRDALRQGTHSVKGRADVRGTTKKYAPQKGRGSARVSSRRSPIFRGGGVVHGPKPRSHATELQVKVRELGIRSTIAAKYAANELVLTNNITNESIPDGKTRVLVNILNQHYPPRSITNISLTTINTHRKFSSILIVSGILSSCNTLLRSASNLPYIKVIPACQINVIDLLRHEYCVLDHDARKYLEWRLKPTNRFTSLLDKK